MIMPPGTDARPSYLVIQWDADNPGVWPLVRRHPPSPLSTYPPTYWLFVNTDNLVSTVTSPGIVHWGSQSMCSRLPVRSQRLWGALQAGNCQMSARAGMLLPDLMGSSCLALILECENTSFCLFSHLLCSLQFNHQTITGSFTQNVSLGRANRLQALKACSQTCTAHRQPQHQSRHRSTSKGWRSPRRQARSCSSARGIPGTLRIWSGLLSSNALAGILHFA